MRRFGAWACAGWLCLAGVASAAGIAVDDTGLAPDEALATQTLVDAARQSLPPGFIEGLGRPVSLRWRDDLPDEVHGRARGGRIGLPRRLLHDWLRNGAPVSGPSPALSALLHELAHIHDHSAAGGLSRNPRLLDLAGWPVRPLRFGLRAAHNDFSDRSPDVYELRSPAEFVAVNFEHFLLDPDYACRRPALHAYFAAHFGWSPATASCTPGLPFVGAGLDDAVVRLVDLDPARVQEVHYLFAEANARPMSRWGHGMLRLVVCAPGRTPGEDCRYDLDHHLVLSFRAFVDDVQVSSLRGLTGSYPSRLFVLPLEQVVDEYTKVELRGLQSVPLRLARGEIDGLLRRAAQVHWSYDGRYYFVSNNCAVEAWKLLQDGVPRLSNLPLRSIAPNGLLRRLVRDGVADATALGDATRAAREGYYFASQGTHFQAMLDVAGSELDLPTRQATAWLDMDPVARSPWLAQGGTRATAALLLLEQAAVRREEAAIREALKQRFLRGRGDDGDIAVAAQALRELLGDGAYAGRPALLLPSGYGIPQEQERALLADVVARDGARLGALQDRLHEDARALVEPRLRARLEAAETNLAILGDRLRMLSRDIDAGASRLH
ncbi:DUF4105 domain-containing protein [Luteimonas aestuarii]|uniref:DUF4105 domain-containing protein n=1 Tax=Luteimonas aestuarii TaxID=453837 RepID=A0A4R5TJM7_9GAMM|nr:DUF4105 domain-containing protein [Luteimonas aestuarii]TDK22312.1 DUF4105 domain-containing protein [Luteimonas aestuarii]